MPLPLVGILVFTAAILIIVILSFIAPAESSHPFWVRVQHIRDRIDLVSYWIINLLSIAAILTALGAVVYSVL